MSSLKLLCKNFQKQESTNDFMDFSDIFITNKFFFGKQVWLFLKKDFYVFLAYD